MKQEDLEKYRSDFAIVRDTATQVMKDFNVAGFKINFSGNELLAYEELKKQITPILWDLFQNQQSQFRNLLYRIDINENHFKRLLQNVDPSAIAESLADLVLQREFQKVLTRRFFS